MAELPPPATSSCRHASLPRRRPARRRAVLLGGARDGALPRAARPGGCREPDRVELAKLCSRVENDWVGAETGLLDQLASLFGADGHALRIDFATLAIEPVPLDLADWQLVTVDSGAAHEHAALGLQRAPRRVRGGGERLGVATLSEATLDAAGGSPSPGAAESATCSPRTRASTRRSTPCATATSRPSAACSTRPTRACATTTTPRSPRSRRLVERLKRAGAAGARMMGGGFGGAVLALFPPGAALPGGATRGRAGAAGAPALTSALGFVAERARTAPRR